MLAAPDLDAVLIATGTHWHGLGSIYAARAGKDVYSEKPVTVTIGEWRSLVDTCKRFGTVYQAGTQRRTTESHQFARELVRIQNTVLRDAATRALAAWLHAGAWESLHSLYVKADKPAHHVLALRGLTRFLEVDNSRATARTMARYGQ